MLQIVLFWLENESTRRTGNRKRKEKLFEFPSFSWKRRGENMCEKIIQVGKIHLVFKLRKERKKEREKVRFLFL